MEKLWHLVELVVSETVKKAVGIISLNGVSFEANVYVVPTQTKPVYRIDLNEVKEAKHD